MMQQTLLQRRQCLRALVLLSVLSGKSVLSPGSQAEAVYHGATIHDAKWVAEGSVFNCSLRQELGSFGSFDFSHRAGEALVFRLRVNDNTLATGEAELVSAPAPWRESGNTQLLARPQVLAGESAVIIESPLSRRLLAELAAGRFPEFRTLSRLHTHARVNIALSPVRFGAAFSAYQRCVAELLPVNYSQIARNSLPWPSGSTELTAAAKELLDRIILYSAADPSVYAYEVDSFTDTAGDRQQNLRISEARAQRVTAYLVDAGIDVERIATRAHGEREEYLLVKNERNAADRDRNRRVNIVLLRR